MKIAIDIDNVIANTFDDLSHQFSKFMGRKISALEIVKTMRRHKLKMWHYWWHAWRKNLLGQVLPIKGAPETIQAWYSSGFHIRLITSRLPLFRKQTMKWLKNNNIPYHELHHIKERQKHKEAEGCGIFIEDNIEECEVLADFCERVFLFDQPWNQREPKNKNIIRVHNWQQINKLIN